jgi:hypothetical protein
MNPKIYKQGCFASKTHYFPLPHSTLSQSFAKPLPQFNNTPQLTILTSLLTKHSSSPKLQGVVFILGDRKCQRRELETGIGVERKKILEDSR